MNTAHIENVRVQDLKRRVKAFRELYGLAEGQVAVKVSGFFADKGRVMASLSRLHVVDLKASGRVWLLVQDVDGEAVSLRPENDTICDVLFEECMQAEPDLEEEDEDGDVVCCYCGEAVERAEAELVGVGAQGQDLYWCGCSGSNEDDTDEADWQEAEDNEMPQHMTILSVSPAHAVEVEEQGYRFQIVQRGDGRWHCHRCNRLRCAHAKWIAGQSVTFPEPESLTDDEMADLIDA